MRKTRHISLKECYAILQLPKDATLDDVKRAYRRRAFELHPDLNPDTPNAGYQFQDLNEAYVALTRVLETEEERQKAAAAAEERRQKDRAEAEAKRQKERAEAEARRQREKAEAEQKREAERRASQEEKVRQREEKERIRQEKAREREEARAKAEQEAREQAQARAEAREQADWQKQREEWAEKVHAERQRASQAYEQEDVLRDLLDDPFARRVFEDIYSAVNKQGGKKQSTQEATSQSSDASKTDPSQDSAGGERQKEYIRPQSESAAGQSQAKADPRVTKVEATTTPPTAEVTFSDTKGSLQAGNSFSGKIMGWFKHQIDEEQTIKLPARCLFVGARIRLQIRRGLSEELSTVEITLPKEFVVGKPLRLKGLGKKVGKWQGDLYLTIESK